MESQVYSRTEPVLLPYYPRLVYLSLLQLGYTEAQLFDKLEIGAAQLHDEHFRLSIEQHEEFILRALTVSGDPHLALRLAKMQHTSNANYALLAVANSGNISKALHMTMRYNRIFTRVCSIRSIETDEHVFMDIDSHLEHNDVIYFAMSAFVLFLDSFFLEALNGAHLVLRAELMVPEPAGFDDVRAQFPFPVLFDCQRNRVYFNRECIDQPLRQADPQTLRLLIEMSDRQLEEAEAEMSLVGAVKSLVIEQLASPPRLDDVARTLGISSRGLRRKLSQSGTTYKGIVDSVRMKMALKLLNESDAPVSSIAYELGFASASDFGRAFKRYNGVSPSSARSSSR